VLHNGGILARYAGTNALTRIQDSVCGWVSVTPRGIPHSEDSVRNDGWVVRG
jgi:hypothetical protein